MLVGEGLNGRDKKRICEKVPHSKRTFPPHRPSVYVFINNILGKR